MKTERKKALKIKIAKILIGEINFKKPHLEREHNIVKEGGKGTQKIWRFENGYGASVVRFSIGNFFGRERKTPIGSYGIEKKGLWELAVIKFSEKIEGGFEICYNTPITQDVIGRLTGKEVEEILKRIKEL